MVRVGGGWDEFEHFLSRHDPEKIGKVLICEFYNHIFKNFQYSFLIYPDIALMVYAWQHGKEITLKKSIQCLERFRDGTRICPTGGGLGSPTGTI